jgi:multidrug resistance efflux pump
MMLAVADTIGGIGEIGFQIGGAIALVAGAVRVMLFVVQRTAEMHRAADEVAQKAIDRAQATAEQARADYEQARADLDTYRTSVMADRAAEAERWRAMEAELAEMRRNEAEWTIERTKLMLRVEHLEHALARATDGRE